ncbi:MAG: helix-turn-helix domain-containing protein [Sandaracinaceae bacterium]|nr:helix-turn-helix domain-containing protein [Sandaracinaceae bacterium]
MKGPETELLTVDEVAALLRTTVKGVYYLVEHRRIPHLKLGRRIRFVRSDVLSWLEQNRVPSLEKKR